MANRSTTAKVNRRGSEFTIQQHETDSPILPVAQLEQLQKFKPDAVDWVMQQTLAESEFRRKESHRINTLVFAERLIGQIFSLIIGVTGIGTGGYIAIQGQPWAGTTIAGAAITGLAVVFLTGRKK